MTKTRIKKDGINITIENNLFSKNKTSKKKEEDVEDDLSTGMPAYQQPPNPFEPEPAFLGEIRNHMAEKRFYNMRINPVRPMYNDMNMVHQKILEQNENVNDDVYQSSVNNDTLNISNINDDALSQFETSRSDQVFFNQQGEYIYNKEHTATFRRTKERTRQEYLNFTKKPKKESLKKYGLPDDFLEDYDRKKREYFSRQRDD